MAPSSAQVIPLLIAVVVATTAILARLLPNNPDLLRELARDQYAWSSSTTDVPISTVSVYAKQLLSGYRNPEHQRSQCAAQSDRQQQQQLPSQRCDEFEHPRLGNVEPLLPIGDTLKLQPVRDRLNERRLVRIQTLCSKPASLITLKDKVLATLRATLAATVTESSCDFNQVDPQFGLTPLHIAHFENDRPLIDYLSASGAVPREDIAHRLPRNLSFTNFIRNAKAYSTAPDCDFPVVDFASDGAHREVRRLLLEGEPVLMRGAYAQYATQPWDLSDFLATFGDEKVTVGSVPYADAFNLTTSRMKLADFYARFVRTDNGDNSYVFNKHADICRTPYTALSALISDVFPVGESNLFVHPNKTGHLAGIHFFFGRALTGAPFHVHADAINAAVSGRKRWFVYTPGKTLYSRKTIRNWVHEDLPRLDDADTPLQCVQQPGDVVYVPLDWGHAVLNLDDDTFGVALEILNRRDTFAHLTGHA